LQSSLSCSTTSTPPSLRSTSRLHRCTAVPPQAGLLLSVPPGIASTRSGGQQQALHAHRALQRRPSRHPQPTHPCLPPPLLSTPHVPCLPACWAPLSCVAHRISFLFPRARFAERTNELRPFFPRCLPSLCSHWLVHLLYICLLLSAWLRRRRRCRHRPPTL
jgi:hypothetical protein